MQTSWYNSWGCGRGFIKKMAPQTRFLCGFILLTSSMITPAFTRWGMTTISLLVLFWMAMCRPPGRMVWLFTQLGLVIFLPYFLLMPFLLQNSHPDAAGWANAFFPIWSVFLHGMAGLYITTTAITTLTMSDLRQALLSLPIPNVVSAILLQIVHQTTELVGETQRMMTAIVVRSATGKWITSVRVLFSIPKVWLPRVILRADRVAEGMEIRGFCDGDIQHFDKTKMTTGDGVVLLFMVLIFVFALLLRVGKSS